MEISTATAAGPAPVSDSLPKVAPVNTIVIDSLLSMPEPDRLTCTEAWAVRCALPENVPRLVDWLKTHATTEWRVPFSMIFGALDGWESDNKTKVLGPVVEAFGSESELYRFVDEGRWINPLDESRMIMDPTAKDLNYLNASIACGMFMPCTFVNGIVKMYYVRFISEAPTAKVVAWLDSAPKRVLRQVFCNENAPSVGLLIKSELWLETYLEEYKPAKIAAKAFRGWIPSEVVDSMHAVEAARFVAEKIGCSVADILTPTVIRNTRAFVVGQDKLKAVGFWWSSLGKQFDVLDSALFLKPTTRGRESSSFERKLKRKRHSRGVWNESDSDSDSETKKARSI